MGVNLCEIAEGMGYSLDLCSYARTDIAAATNNGGPIGGLPKPDFLVCCNNICGTVLKWYEVQARYFDVPLFIFDTPFIHDEFSDEAKKYVTRQANDYLDFLEKVTGRKVNEDKLEEVADLFKVHRSTISRYAKSGELRSYLLGSRRLFKSDEVWSFFENQVAQNCVSGKED